MGEEMEKENLEYRRVEKKMKMSRSVMKASGK